MVATAFSFSNSRIGWSSVIRSPSLTNKFTTVPESAPSPRAGSLLSIVETRCNLAQKRARSSAKSNACQFRQALKKSHCSVLDAQNFQGSFAEPVKNQIIFEIVQDI